MNNIEKEIPETVENLDEVTGGGTARPGKTFTPTGPRLKETLFCEHCQYTFTVPMTPMRTPCPRCGNMDLRIFNG